MKRYLLNILIIFDKAVNVLLGPLLNYMLPISAYEFGDHRDTLSEVFGRNKESCRLCKTMCKLLGWVDTKHCEKSIED